MEENKVTISLKEYVDLYEGQKETNAEMQVLVELLFQNTGLTSDSKELKFDYYASKIIRFLKEKYPEKYKEQLKILQELEEE